MTGPISYRLPDDRASGEIERQVASRFGIARTPETVTIRTLHDSFDWRIHRAGGTYETSGRDSDRVHLWRDADGRVRHRLRHPADPGFPADLPTGALREALAECLEMRRLLPVAEVTVKARTVAVLDGEEKTTVRIRFESGSTRDPARGEAHEFAPTARVLPVRGYDKERQRVVKLLGEECGLPPAPGTELEQVLAPLGRKPGDYTSKFRLTLDPAMPAADAARAIHLALLDTMLRNEAGTRDDLDSEFLHDFRVAIRRTRSALTQISGVYPPLVVERFKDEFRWLGTLTGPLRDLDVYLLKMDSYRKALPEEVRDDLNPLGDYLHAKQRAEHHRLVEALDSKRYSDLVARWRAFLAHPSSEPAGLANADRPALAVASERIWRVYRGMIKRGRAIGDDTPAAALHDLRIRGKKLRYLLEFFRSLFPEKAIGRLIGELKRLQDNLGDFNDYQVQRLTLEEFAGELSKAGKAPVRTQLAMGRLLNRLDAGQFTERRRFGNRFETFAARENRKTFQRLFSGGSTS